MTITNTIADLRFVTADYRSAADFMDGAAYAEEWGQAFEAWLAYGPIRPRSPNTQRAYRRAWADLLEEVEKPFWRILSVDVRDWVEVLRRRDLDMFVEAGLIANGRRRVGQIGLSPGTVAQYLAAISSFYSYAMTRHLVETPDGREAPLYGGPNPTQGGAVTRPEVDRYDKAHYLTVEQLRELLAEIRAGFPVKPVQARRDYALILTLIATAARSTEARELRWGDLVRRGGKMFYHWRNKGKTGLDELPAQAWAAIQDYLAAAGRIGSMQPGDPLFTALDDRAARLPSVDGATWQPAALSGRATGQLLKRYARRAGIQPARVCVHTLRHSATMLLLEAGISLPELMRQLHHSSLTTTTTYVHRLAGQEAPAWEQEADLLGI